MHKSFLKIIYFSKCKILNDFLVTKEIISTTDLAVESAN